MARLMRLFKLPPALAGGGVGMEEGFSRIIGIKDHFGFSQNHLSIPKLDLDEGCLG